MPADYAAAPGGRRHANGKHVSGPRLVRGPSAALTAVSGAIVLCGALAGLAWAGHTARPATPLGRTHVAPAPKGQWAAAPDATARPVAHPTALDIPTIGVQTRLIRLALPSPVPLQVPARAPL